MCAQSFVGETLPTLCCQRLLIPLWCRFPVSAAKALCLQKLTWSAAAALSRQGGGESTNPPSEFRQASCFETRHVSLLVAANVSSPHPCFFFNLYIYFLLGVHIFLEELRSSSIEARWAQRHKKKEEKKRIIMTDNHIIFVIFGNVPREKLIQLPFSNPAFASFKLQIFMCGLHAEWHEHKHYAHILILFISTGKEICVILYFYVPRRNLILHVP